MTQVVQGRARNMQDNRRSGQPKMQRTDANVDRDRVRTLVHSDWRVGVRVIAEELNMNRETMWQIVKEDVGMRKISTKMVPQILTHDHKQRRLHISSDLLCNAEMFYRVITGDEIKKCPEGTKICWPFWLPTQLENFTARYSGKRFSRLFLAVAP